MDIRPAVGSDIAAIAEVHVRSWQETYVGQVPRGYLDGLSIEDRTSRWQETLIDAEWPNPDLLVLLDNDDIVVGFATTSASRDADAAVSTGEVPAIYTRRRVWGRGWGRDLMQAALRRLSEAGFADATLWVLDTNERARRFYEAGGWRWDGATKPHVIGGQEVIEVRYRVSLA
jgi:ribosomal protein S18 acetylase RimI-like enzyme